MIKSRKGNKAHNFDGKSMAYRVQGKVKHDNMIDIQVQSPSGQVSADECRAISIIALEPLQVLNPTIWKNIVLLQSV